MPGGALLMRPLASGGATPMLPKNGRSGISIVSLKCATIRFSSSGMIFIFEDVAGFGTFNVDGAGEDVSAGAFVGDGRENLAERRLDLIGLDARAFES